MAGFIAIKQAVLHIVRIQKIEQIYNLFWKMLASRRIDVGSVLKNTLPPECAGGVSSQLCTCYHTSNLTLMSHCPPKLIYGRCWGHGYTHTTGWWVRVCCPAHIHNRASGEAEKWRQEKRRTFLTSRGGGLPHGDWRTLSSSWQAGGEQALSEHRASSAQVKQIPSAPREEIPQ